MHLFKRNDVFNCNLMFTVSFEIISQTKVNIGYRGPTLINSINYNPFYKINWLYMVIFDYSFEDKIFEIKRLPPSSQLCQLI